MNLEQLISPAIPILKPSDTGNRVLELMEEHHFSQLPLIQDDTYVGLIRENDVLDWEKPEEDLSKAEFRHYRPSILASAHAFEAFRIMYDADLYVLPVIDHEGKYAGCMTRDNLFKYVAEKSGIDNPGGIIVLEIAPRNYTLYEIARICENEDVIILNLQVHTNADSTLQVTLKLNRTALDAVVSSFERHNYHVTEVYGEEVRKEDIEEKYHLLMNYINM
jgi:acetoin utilization protein AcuB